jgi:hypothetical protein
MANDAIAPGLRADLTRAFDILQMGPPLGAPMQPNDAGRLDMPLFEVVYWIVTKGGSIGFDHSIRAQWNEAWAELLGAWRQNQVTITGRPASGGFPEKIAGETIAGVRIVHPFGADPLEGPPSGTGPYIQSFGRTADDESWEKGRNDQLYRPENMLGWTHLQALGTEVGRRWPVASFAQARPPETAKDLAVDAAPPPPGDETPEAQPELGWIQEGDLNKTEADIFDVIKKQWPNDIPHYLLAPDRDAQIATAMRIKNYVRGFSGGNIKRVLAKCRFGPK